ncbi:MAG TPA: hypothetical protein VGQ71_06910 [Terriglobales bacterium]|nr:hypothetical protein [Terriglobales bacterium]
MKQLLMSPEALARALDDFLADARSAVVLEGGEAIFDLANARYSITSDHGKCVLHIWSEERNTVRRVLDAEARAGSLRLTVQRFGQARPAKLEICRERDRRSPTARHAARAAYHRLLGRVLECNFPDFTVERLSTSADLERSFSAVYTRGLLRRGNRAFAVLGVNAKEMQAAIDAALTFGLLWLDSCRQAIASRAAVVGLKLFVPAGTSPVVRQRMAHLNHAAAQFELYELEERDRAIEPVDCSDRGNIATRLLRCSDPHKVRERFAGSIRRLLEIVPDAEVAVLSSAEVAFRLRGLEFARARLIPEPGSFRHVEQIVFGAVGREVRLDELSADDFAEFVRLLATRRADGPRDHPFWRAQPERWLESLVSRDVTMIDSRLDPGCVYSQVPAFSASDRAMIDVLASSGDGRLAVLELKAEEDIHLPLQGLDYWARVAWHHARGEFKQFGYFPGRELSPDLPLLLLVTPALHVHPATDALLRYLAPEIEWELVGIDERWREGVRVVFRKRRGLSC